MATDKGKVPSHGEFLTGTASQEHPEGGTFLVSIYSTQATTNSCRISYKFDKDGLTSFGGAALLIDCFREHLNVRQLLDSLPIEKAPWATYTLGDDLETLLVAYALGIERIEHMDVIEHDPLLRIKLDLDKLPHKTSLYRALDRFSGPEHVDALYKINKQLLPALVDSSKPFVLDLDTTVETVHGTQEGSSRGYNHRYPGRNSYQPFLAFDGNSQALINVELRDGSAPSANDIVAFFRKTLQALPKGINLKYVRADRGFGSDRFMKTLEEEGVKYTIKIKLYSSLVERMERGILWQRIYFDEHKVIEVGAVGYKANCWDTNRRIVLVRSTEYATNGQQRLFDLWDYQAIATNLDWAPEDIWRFYNQRCNSENYIKELKYGVNIDNIGKEEFWPNAADLWIKCLAYNCLLAFKQRLAGKAKRYSLARLRRMLILIPGIITRHARRWTLHLPRWWPFKRLWRQAVQV